MRIDPVLRDLKFAVSQLLLALDNRLTAAENLAPEGTQGNVLTSNGPNVPPTYQPIPTAEGDENAVTSVHGRTGAVTGEVGDYSFSEIVGKPTTIAGYGITDAYTDAEVDTLLTGYYTSIQVDALLAALTPGDLVGWPADAVGYLENDGAGNLSWTTPGGGGAIDLDDLTDVVITAAANKEVLAFNGTNWVDQALDASYIAAGTFDAGNFVFPGDLTVTTDLHIAGLTYDWPTAHDAGVLYNSGAGVLAWQDLKIITPSALRDRKVYMIHMGAGATLVESLGGQNIGTGAATAPNLADTNVLTRQSRVLFTSSTANNAPCGVRGTHYYGMSKTGFVFTCMFSIEANLNGGRCFVGLGDSVSGIAVAATEPSAQTNCIGMGYDGSDSSAGDWFIIHNDGAGAATKVPTGIPRSTTTLFRLELSTDDGSVWDVKIANLSTGSYDYIDTAHNTDIPVDNVPLRPFALGKNAALGVAEVLGFCYLYMEHGTTWP